MSLREQARAVVALHVAAEAIRYTLQEQAISNQDFPDIHGNDWSHIVAEAILISANSRPKMGELEDALKLLATDALADEHDEALQWRDADTLDELDPEED
jgi:hypothetical protein